MKKNYKQPKLNIIEIEENIVIATSTVHNFGFGGEEYQAPTAAEEWNWN